MFNPTLIIRKHCSTPNWLFESIVQPQTDYSKALFKPVNLDEIMIMIILCLWKFVFFESSGRGVRMYFHFSTKSTDNIFKMASLSVKTSISNGLLPTQLRKKFWENTVPWYLYTHVLHIPVVSLNSSKLPNFRELKNFAFREDLSRMSRFTIFREILLSPIGNAENYRKYNSTNQPCWDISRVLIFVNRLFSVFWGYLFSRNGLPQTFREDLISRIWRNSRKLIPLTTELILFANVDRNIYVFLLDLAENRVEKVEI